MRVAATRLDVINEAEIMTFQVRKQTNYFKKLKSKAFSLPVISSAVGVLSGVLLVRMLMGRKHHHTPPATAAPGGILNSSLFRLILELLITLALPSMKQMGMALVRGKISSLLSFGRR